MARKGLLRTLLPCCFDTRSEHSYGHPPTEHDMHAQRLAAQAALRREEVSLSPSSSSLPDLSPECFSLLLRERVLIWCFTNVGVQAERRR